MVAVLQRFLPSPATPSQRWRTKNLKAVKPKIQRACVVIHGLVQLRAVPFKAGCEK